MGLQDRDYMHERHRRAQSSRATQGKLDSLGRWLNFGSLGGMSTLSRVLVVGIVMLIVFLAVKYGLTHRASVPFPATGEVHWYVNDGRPRVARLTLRARESSSYRYFAVMLDDWASGAPVAMIPVRVGETSVTLMPLGRYRMTIAKGTIWMGTNKQFGITGESKVAVHPVEFYRRGNQVFGHSIDLEVPFVGNLEMAPDRAPGLWR